MSLGDSNDPGWTGYDQKLAERIAGEAYDIAQLASIRHRDPALALSIAEQSGKEHDRTFSCIRRTKNNEGD